MPSSSRKTTSDRPKTPETNSQVENPFKGTPHTVRLASSVHHKVTNENGTPELPVKRNKDEVEKRLEREIINGAMKGSNSLIEAVCHDSFLKVDPKEVAAVEALRHNDEWTKWPKKKKTIHETTMEKFLKLISDTLDALGLPSSERRFWTSMFFQHPVSDSEWGTDYMPDLVLLMRFVAAVDRGTITWADILAVMEIKTKRQKAANRQIARYVQCIFNAQPGRRFVLALTVVGKIVTLWIFDRSGAIACEPFNIHKEPMKFLRIIISTFHADLEHLGYDHTIYKKEGSKDSFINVGGIEYKVNCIYQEPGINGRGTTCYRGESEEPKSVVVIKDSWVDVSRGETEVEILEKLNKRKEKDLCTPDGVRVIPKIVASEIVKTHRPCPIEGKEILVDDLTSIFREELVELVDGKQKWAWTSKEKKEKTEIRAHYRVAMTPFGQKLENFMSLKGLMGAFSDIVHAIRILHEAGVIHRDISFRNVLLHDHEGQLRGLLIDYDYAVSMNRPPSSAIAERTGTLPFMAIDRLDKDPSFPHSYFHDLESLFYVLCWMSTLYSGPKNTERAFDRTVLPYRETEVALWNGEKSNEGTIMAVCNAKGTRIARLAGFKKTIKQFATYFQPIFGCLETLQKLLFKSEDDNEELQRQLEEELDLVGKCDSLPQDLIDRCIEIPIHSRPPRVVLDSFTLAFTEVAKKLPEVDVIIAEKPTGDVKIQKSRPRPVRHFVERIVPGILEDLDRDDDDDDDDDEGSSSEDDSDEDSDSPPEPSNHSFASSSSRIVTRSMNKRKLTEEVGVEQPTSKRSKSSVPSEVRSVDKIPQLRKSGAKSGQRRSKDHEFAKPALKRSLRSASRLKGVQEDAK